MIESLSEFLAFWLGTDLLSNPGAVGGIAELLRQTWE